MNDLKTVRDVIEKFIDAKNKAENFLPTKTSETLSRWLTCFMAHVNYNLSYRNWEELELAKATIERIIETPAPQGCVDDQPKCTWDFYRSTLERFVYETTHLSAENADGSHDCKISKKCLLHGRIALELLGKLSAAPTPAPSEKVDVDTAMRTLWDAGYKIHGQFGWVTDDRAKTGRLR